MSVLCGWHPNCLQKIGRQDASSRTRVFAVFFAIWRCTLFPSLTNSLGADVLVGLSTQSLVTGVLVSLSAQSLGLRRVQDKVELGSINLNEVRDAPVFSTFSNNTQKRNELYDYHTVSSYRDND